MIRLSSAEHGIVSMARALVDRPGGPVRGLLYHPMLPAGYLSSDARCLIDEALAFGWVEVLARAGGWRRRDGGRLWHRYRDVAMSFSRFAPQLIEWLATAPARSARPPLEATPETAGDRLLCFLAARLAESAGCQWLIGEPAIAGTWLVQVGFARSLAAIGADPEPAALDLDDPAERLVVDGLGDLLARRLVDLERSRSTLLDLDAVIAAGRLQAAALGALAAATEEHPELARFVFEAAAAIAEAPPVYAEAIGPGSVAERSAARAAAAAFIRALDPWRRRAEAARAVRFFEDDFERSQQVLRLWETLGDRRHARLVAIADELESAGPSS